MTDSFEIEKYAIVSSLNERNIYVKVIDRILFMCYEANVDSKELRLPIEINNTYQLMTKCFKREPGYNAVITISSGIMKVLFNALVEGYLKLSFEIILREKVMSNDSQLSMNFHRIEQKQEQAVQHLTERLSQLERLVDIISYAEINMIKMCHFNSHSCRDIFWKVNTTEMSLTGEYWDYSKIKLFYQLEKLTLISCNQFVNFTNDKMNNDNVKELYLNSLSAGNFTSLVGLDGFPKLEKLTISGCSHLRDVVAVLNSYKHRIHTIDIKACGSINNTEIMTYCQKNNIKLNLA
jgi:hypothetical protein